MTKPEPVAWLTVDPVDGCRFPTAFKKKRDDQPLYPASALADARRAALEQAIAVLTNYQVPIGNSPAGALACDWTIDALRKCRAEIRALKDSNGADA